MRELDLSKVKTSILQSELNRRQKIIDDKEDKISEKKRIKDYLNRPKCAVTGYAYGSLYYHDVKQYNLASILIRGNCSFSYSVSMNVCPAVETYLNNALTDDDTAELETKLKNIANDFIKAKCSDPAIVTTLICLAEDAGGRPLNEMSKLVYSEWHKSAILRLGEYTLDELTVAKDKLLRNGKTSHGQIKLLDEVIKSKGE
jgi:hypothetical protein